MQREGNILYRRMSNQVWPSKLVLLLWRAQSNHKEKASSEDIDAAENDKPGDGGEVERGGLLWRY